MLVGSIREKNVIELVAEAKTLSEARARVEAQVPAGYDLTSAIPSMSKGAASVTVTGKAALRGEIREIEADDRAALDAKVPDGWELLGVRKL